MAKRVGKGWCISSNGTVHLPHPTRDGYTLCLRRTAGMKKSWDGSLYTDCKGCQAITRHVVVEGCTTEQR